MAKIAVTNLLLAIILASAAFINTAEAGYSGSPPLFVIKNEEIIKNIDKIYFDNNITRYELLLGGSAYTAFHFKIREEIGRIPYILSGRDPTIDSAFEQAVDKFVENRRDKDFFEMKRLEPKDIHSVQPGSALVTPIVTLALTEELHVVGTVSLRLSYIPEICDVAKNMLMCPVFIYQTPANVFEAGKLQTDFVRFEDPEKDEFYKKEQEKGFFLISPTNNLAQIFSWALSDIENQLSDFYQFKKK